MQLYGTLNILWHCPSLRLEWKHLLQSYGHCWVFRICYRILCSSLTTSSFRIWNSSGGIPSFPLAWFPTWLRPPGYLALGEWPHHRGYHGHEDLFCIVLLCILVTSSYSLLLLLGPYCFCHFLCLSLHEIFPWYLHFSWRDSSLSHSIIFLCIFALFI